jgi:hypothetical protein
MLLLLDVDFASVGFRLLPLLLAWTDDDEEERTADE